MENLGSDNSLKSPQIALSLKTKPTKPLAKEPEDSGYEIDGIHEVLCCKWLFQRRNFRDIRYFGRLPELLERQMHQMSKMESDVYVLWNLH